MTMRKILCLFFALLGVVSFFASIQVHAQIPRSFSYQGVIHGGGGQPIPNDDHAITITFYDVATGGTALYSETHSTRTNNGIFNVMIGSVTPMPAALAFDKTYYLGIRINGSEELTPRTALASAPYALRAAFADVATRLAGDVKGVVTSVNELAGSLRIEGDSTMTVTQSGQTIKLSAKQSSNVVYKGIDSIQSPQKTLSIVNPAGNVTRVDVADSAISTLKLARGSVTSEKLNAMGATNGQILKWNGTAWVPATDAGAVYTAGIGINITGTNISVSRPMPNGTLLNSTLRWDGTQWLENLNLTSDATGLTTARNHVEVASNGGASELRLFEPQPSGANYTAFKAQSQNTNIVYTLPATLPLSQSFLASDNTGALTWSNSISASVTTDATLAGNGTVATPLRIAQQSALPGEVLTWNGTTWLPGTNGLLTAAVTPRLSGAGTTASPLDIAQQGATPGQMLKWNGTTWLPADDLGITLVSATAPITGSGTSSSPLTIAAASGTTNGYLTSTDWTTFNNKLSTVAVTARLTGNGTTGNPLDIAQQGATNGQVLSWNGTTWLPANGGLSSVSVTAPITGNGTVGNPLAMAAANGTTNGYLTSTDWTTFNNKLSTVAVTARLIGNGTTGNPLDIAQQGATNGQVLSWNGTTWVPANSGLSSVTTDATLTGNGTVATPLRVAQQGATTGQALKWNGTTWLPADDNGLTSVLVTARLTGNGTTGNPLDIAQQGATNGQVLSWNGTTWVPANSGLSTVSVTAPITGNGTVGNPLAMAAANGTTNGYLTSTDWTTFNNKLSTVAVTARLIGNGTTGNPLDIAQQGATNGQVLSWNGTTWLPANGGLSSVSVTAPITGNGTVGNPLVILPANGTTNGYLTSTDWTTFNNKLSTVAVTARLIGNGTTGNPLDIAQQGATNGQVLSWNGTTWVPANSGLSTVTTDATLTGNGTVATPLRVAQQGATTGQALKWNGTTWLPGDDNGLTSVSVTARLIGNGTTGNPLDIAQQGATNGQVLSWNGTTWLPANGGLSSVSVTAPITGNGTVGNPLVMAAANGTTNGYLTSTDWTTFNNKLSTVAVTARLIGNGTTGNPLDIAQQGATNGQVLSWNGTTWVPANGGLSSVSVTAPITGDGTAGNPLAMAAANGTTNGYLTLADWTTFNNKLTSVAVTARLIGNGTTGNPLDIAQQGATNGQVLSWNGTTWVPANGGLSSVSVTAPITGNGTVGNPLAMAAANGTTNGYLTSTDWTTFNNKLSTVAVTARLTGNGTVGSPLDIAQQGAANGQVLAWNGTIWAPANDNGGTVSVTARISGNGTPANPLDIAQQGATNSQVLAWNGANWVPANPGLSTVSANAPITGAGTPGSPLIIAAANGSTNGYLTSTDWTTFNNKLSIVAVTARLTGNGTTGNPLDLAQQGATNGQVLSWNGVSWIPANGGLSTVSVTAPITGNGTLGSPLAIAAANTTTSGYLTSTDWNTFNNKLSTVAVTARLSGNGTVGSPLDIAQQGATTGQVLRWSGTTWLPGTDNGLTTVSVTVPITGNGTSGSPIALAQATSSATGYLTSTDWNTFNNKLTSVSVTARLTGNGTAGNPLEIAQQGATNGQVLTWNGSIWSPAAVGGLTTVAVTARLTGNGTAGNPLDLAQQGATNGQVLSWNGSTWSPAAAGLSTVSTTARLSGTGTVGNPLDIAQQGATNGQVLTWNGATWSPAAGGLSAVAVTARLTGNGTAGNPLDIAQQGATNGQVLSWNGTTWLPANGGISSVSVTAPITGNGTSGNPLAMAAANGSTNGYLTSTDWTTFNNKLSTVAVTARLIGNGTTGSPLDIAQQGATNGQALTWNGTTWVPTTIGGLTTVAVTAPITGNGTVGTPLALAAANGSTNGYLTSTDWTTFNNKLTFVTTTARFSGNGTSGSPLELAQQSATSGQVLKWNGASWAPSSDIGLATVTTDATLTGNGTSGSPLGLASQSATSGQVLKWNGSTWLPGADNTVANGTATDNTLRWSGSAWVETARVTSSTNGMLTVAGTGGVGGVNLSGTTTPLLLNFNAGTSGFVLASQGTGNTPLWVDPATFAPPSWQLAGNTLTGASSSSPTQFFGSNNLYDVVFRSNGTERMRIASGGTVAIGTSTTNLAKFRVSSTLPGTATQRHGAYIDATLNTDPGVYSNGMEVQYNVSNSGALGAGSQVDGSIVAITSLQGAGTNAARGAIGLVAVGSSTANATHTNLDGLTGRVYVQSAGSNTTITNAVAVRADLYMLTSDATITNGYGFRVDNPFDGSHFTAGTISNFTGVYVQDISTGAGSRNAIFYDAAGTSSPFVVTAAGRTGIGNPTPAEKLEVRNGNLLLSNNTGTASQLQFMNPAATFNSTFAAGAQTATYNYTLPTVLPTANQVMTATAITGTGPYAVTLGWTTPAGGSSWGILGNGGTVAGTNFIGTTDDIALDVRTFNTVRLRFNTTTNSIQRTTTGNARGTDAIDLQATRAAITQVAGATGSVISGGENNEIGTSATYSVVGGGLANTISATHSSIVGGNGNTASGSYNTVLGGRGLTLSGNYSVGYNAGTTAMSVSDGNTAVIGNTNLWLANNNNTASDLRFYEANSGGAGAFPPANLNYSAIRSGVQTNDITYVLPTTQPSAAGSMLQTQSITGTGPYTVALTWSSVGSQGWLLNGNNIAIADTSTNFIGSTGNVFVEIHANEGAGTTGGNQRMFRFEPHTTSPNLIGGHRLNWIAGDFLNATTRAYGASILGGGDDSNPNRVTDNYGIVLGGKNNRAGDGAGTIGDNEYAVVAGGFSNTAAGQYSFIAGGGNLTLGDNSFGFNGRQTGGAPSTADISSQTGVAYFGDVNLWIGNVGNSARQLRFYEPNSSSTYASANYTAFQAGAQTADITYTLPITAPATSHRLMMGSTTGQLSWSQTITFDSTNARLGVNTNAAAATTVDVNGDLAMRRNNVAVANGNNHNLNIGNYSFIKLTGTNNFTITGFAGGVDGKMIVIYNATGQIMTVSNNDNGSNAANRIRTKNGNNYVTANAGDRDVITLIYDSASSEWIVVSTN